MFIRGSFLIGIAQEDRNDFFCLSASDREITVAGARQVVAQNSNPKTTFRKFLVINFHLPSPKRVSSTDEPFSDR
jgi:hypothetical protein